VGHGPKQSREARQFLRSDVSGEGIWGRGGIAIGADGTVYAESGDGRFDPDTGKYGDTVLVLLPKQLKLLDDCSRSSVQID
jgi:hypothetical protein